MCLVNVECTLCTHTTHLRDPYKWISYYTRVSRIWSTRLGLQPISKCFVTQQMYTSRTSLHEAMLKCHILFKFWNLEAYFLKFSPRLKINSDVTLPSNHILLSSKLEPPSLLSIIKVKKCLKLDMHNDLVIHPPNSIRSHIF